MRMDSSFLPDYPNKREGYRIYVEEGLEPSEEVRKATAEYQDDMDKLTQFLKDECVTGDQGLLSK